VYLNQNPKCEPQLGKRGLYQSVGGQSHTRFDEMVIFWILNLSDGAHSLLDIAKKSGYQFSIIKETADLLSEKGLLERATPPQTP